MGWGLNRTFRNCVSVTELPQILHHNRQVVRRIFTDLGSMGFGWGGSEVFNMRQLALPCRGFQRAPPDYMPGLGTAFFYILNASFFCVLLKNATFFYVLFSSFW